MLNKLAAIFLRTMFGVLGGSILGLNALFISLLMGMDEVVATNISLGVFLGTVAGVLTLWMLSCYCGLVLIIFGIFNVSISEVFDPILFSIFMILFSIIMGLIMENLGGLSNPKTKNA